tara:strand:+ start:184 stop:426 length:243 start_codon:yes stop_codon:yes gene_type:complete
MALKRKGNSQGLSPTALRAKRSRDKAAAMSEWGKFKKRTAQTSDCPKGYDFDHALGKCIKKKSNRKKNSRSGATKNKYGY